MIAVLPSRSSVMSASFASWSPMFYEVKHRLPRKLIGGAMRRPGRAWSLSDHSSPASCTTVTDIAIEHLLIIRQATV
jgi:hypothetical protein